MMLAWIPCHWKIPCYMITATTFAWIVLQMTLVLCLMEFWINHYLPTQILGTWVEFIFLGDELVNSKFVLSLMNDRNLSPPSDMGRYNSSSHIGQMSPSAPGSRGVAISTYFLIKDWLWYDLSWPANIEWTLFAFSL